MINKLIKKGTYKMYKCYRCNHLDRETMNPIWGRSKDLKWSWLVISGMVIVICEGLINWTWNKSIKTFRISKHMNGHIVRKGNRERHCQFGFSGTEKTWRVSSDNDKVLISNLIYSQHNHSKFSMMWVKL